MRVIINSNIVCSCFSSRIQRFLFSFVEKYRMTVASRKRFLHSLTRRKINYETWSLCSINAAVRYTCTLKTLSPYRTIDKRISTIDIKRVITSPLIFALFQERRVPKTNTEWSTRISKGWSSKKSFISIAISRCDVRRSLPNSSC